MKFVFLISRTYRRQYLWTLEGTDLLNSNILAKLPLILLGSLYPGESDLGWWAWWGSVIVDEEQKLYQCSSYLSWMKPCKWKFIPHVGIVAPQNIRLLCFWSCFMSQNAVWAMCWSCLTMVARRTHLQQEKEKKHPCKEAQWAKIPEFWEASLNS